MLVLTKSCGRVQEEKWELVLVCLPCWHHAGQRIDLIYPSRCWVQKAVTGFGGCEVQHIWCLVPLVLARMEESLCVRLACGRLLFPVPGLHLAPREEGAVGRGLEFVSKPGVSVSPETRLQLQFV